MPNESPSQDGPSRQALRIPHCHTQTPLVLRTMRDQAQRRRVLISVRLGTDPTSGIVRSQVAAIIRFEVSPWWRIGEIADSLCAVALEP
jgi:hypothetical protein